jgi:hypothetical protein
MGALAGIVAVLAVLLLSHRFGRADPTEDYRPVVPPDALTNGCYPLPGDVRFSFGYQIRLDGDVRVDGELRRRLIGQYDELDAPEALDAIVADFAAAGFVAARRPAPYGAVLREPGAGRHEIVRVMVEQLRDIEEDTIVRGTFELDLPVVEPPKDAPDVCSQPKSTKRWDDEA